VPFVDGSAIFTAGYDSVSMSQETICKKPVQFFKPVQDYIDFLQG